MSDLPVSDADRPIDPAAPEPQPGPGPGPGPGAGQESGPRPGSCAGAIFDGEDYRDVLARLHGLIEPARYLEIGTETGASLRLAHCASLSIDPAYDLGFEVIGRKPACHFYQQASDAFFRDERPDAILKGPIDFAFLDGLHHFEVLLRDFINTEPYCAPDGIIALHDCLPLHWAMTLRDRAETDAQPDNPFPKWWTGDVWKMLTILRRHRTDLRVAPLAAHPTGLVLVAGLDPANTLLRDRYADIVAEFAPLALAAEDIEPFLQAAGPLPPAHFATRDALDRFRGRTPPG